ncbi:MAG: homoserine kinase [Flavobacteriaceae bacterium]
MKEIRLFVPASVANVSCGFDVLGFCLDPVGDEMVIRKTETPGIRITKIEGQDLPLETHLNVAGVAASALIDEYEPSCGFEIEIYKHIKPGSGIGSSAASSAGAVYGVNQLLGKPFEAQDLIRFAMQGEKLASGSAHADNVAPVILGGFTLVRCSDGPDVIKLPVPQELVATVIHPKIELKTEHSRSVLKQQISLKDAISQWGNLAGLVSGLYENDYDRISRCLVDKIVEPSRAILIPAFDQLKNEATDAGALGCGISGSGPSVYALSKGIDIAKEVATRFSDTLAALDISFETHISTINTTGIRILEQK